MMVATRCVMVAALLMAGATRAGVPASSLPAPVREITVVPFDGGKPGNVMKPAEIKSAEELEKAVPEKKAQEAIAAEIDFSKNVLVLFHWMGSGGDKVEAGVQAGSNGVQTVHFTVTRGRTRDLRTHVKAFAVASNVKWEVVTPSGP